MIIVVGTSSWADPGFVEEWYPEGLPARERLAWYAEHFDAVEVNATFYAVPAVKTVERWVSETPAHFTFDVKLHRLLSRHRAPTDSLPKAIRGEDDLEGKVIEATLEAVEPLRAAGKLSSFLLQLTPAFEPRRHALTELDRIAEALQPLAVELRHRAWVKDERREDTLAWFRERDVAYVCVDAPQGRAPTMMPPLDVVTSPQLAYLRAHGRNAEGYMKGRSVAERFAWDYADDELAELAECVDTLAEQVPTVRMMFNNNRGADAPRAAERMKERLGT